MILLAVIALGTVAGATYFLFSQRQEFKNEAEKDALQLVNLERSEAGKSLLTENQGAKDTAQSSAEMIKSGDYYEQPDEMVGSCFTTVYGAVNVLSNVAKYRDMMLGDWLHMGWGTSYSEQTGCHYYVLKFTK